MLGKIAQVTFFVLILFLAIRWGSGFGKFEGESAEYWYDQYAEQNYNARQSNQEMIEIEREYLNQIKSCKDDLDESNAEREKLYKLGVAIINDYETRLNTVSSQSSKNFECLFDGGKVLSDGTCHKTLR